MSRRLIAPPPDLPGYTYVRPLGSGGFADVYYYEQHMPRRTVAVKVLLSDVAGADAQQMFLSESTVMAQLSSHPSVLTVYEANLCPDGRPYMVMEYCPSGYGDRFRAETIPVPEALQVATAIGSVLETAHQQGILHRDIKPSNILTTHYGKPVLSDFGIAATIAAAAGDDAVGLSVPWSAPEVILGATGGTIQSEVWSFAATIYALLAGRSPFEVPGKPNSREAVQERIVGRDVVRPTGRVDVPPVLEQALARALTKDPARRQSSVLELLHTVQVAEAELGLRPTVLDIPTGHTIDVTPGIAPTRTTARAEGDRPRTRKPRSKQRADHSTTGTVSGETVLRAYSHGTRRASRKALWWGVGAIALVAALVAGGFAIAGALATIPRVEGIETDVSPTSAMFSWEDPGLQAGDSYLVRVDNGPGTPQTSTTFVLDPKLHEGRVCVTVTVVHDDEPGEASAPACTEMP